VFQPKGEGVSAGAAALAAGVIGAGLGAGAVVASRMGKDEDASSESTAKKDE